MYADGILVLGEVRFAGRWLAAPKLIQLNQAWIVSADTNAMDVASTIVHEATYAWLESCGFTFAIGRRQRIEAICYRSEAEFARRIPDGEELSALYERCAQLVLEEGDAEWSDEALQARHAQELRELGAPEWLIKTFVRISP